MPRFTAELSASSLGTMLKDLKAYQQKVEKAPSRIVQSLTDYGKDQVAQGIGSIQDKDGNYLASAGSYVYGNTGFVYMEGEQSAYLEFGAGVEGQSSPHPGAGEAGWQYNRGAKIRSSGYWSYYDKVRGRWVSTKGIPAQMPVLKAALAMRRKLKETAREALR